MTSKMILQKVILVQRYHGTNPADTTRPFGGPGFGYDYDPIGNRLSATETIGGETLTKFYTANALNQYTAIANPDAVGLRGSATNTATVTVNGNAASRDNVTSTVRPWHYALLADNANGPDYTFANIMAVVNPPGTNTPDIVSTESGNVYAPPQAEVLAYDDDGNLLSDGRWEYTWNGENRLVKAEELASPTNRLPHVVEYTYDHRGRMIWKTVASSNAPPSMASRYLWDDYNIIAETVAQHNATNTTYNIWGLDLDGSMQGAGGVGGLLAVIKDSATYVPAWDANGNILEYIAEDGTIVAHREYDPFGGTVVATDEVNAFSHWFSTKPWCAITGLSEYQYRKYSPVLGRWLNRDPIEEKGGSSLYRAGCNDMVTGIDILGMFYRTIRLYENDIWFDDLFYQVSFSSRFKCDDSGAILQIGHSKAEVTSFDGSSKVILSTQIADQTPGGASDSIIIFKYSATGVFDVFSLGNGLGNMLTQAGAGAGIGASIGISDLIPGDEPHWIAGGAIVGGVIGLLTADWIKEHSVTYAVKVEFRCQCEKSKGWQVSELILSENKGSSTKGSMELEWR